MDITPEIRDKIEKHPFMKVGQSDFMRLWEIRNINKIYEIVLTSVAIKEKVHWKTIYNFSPRSPYYSHLCVAILLIYDATKYLSGNLSERCSFMHEPELEIVNSYYSL